MKTRRLLLALLLGAGAFSLGHGQEKEVQAFDGPKPVTSGFFKVADRWEIRWDSAQSVSITLLSTDGQVVAGTSGSGKGSLYQPKGGTFYLQIADQGATGTPPWHVTVVEMGPGNSPVADSAYVPPAATGAAPAPASTPPAPPAPPKKLTDEQARAVVLVKGDSGEGTGFLVKMPDGPAVITNLHVLAANQHVHILTSTGDEIKTVFLKGAADRDLAMIGIQDNHYSYLEIAPDLENVSIGDAVLTPGNSEGGGVILDTSGDVLGIGPDRVEFSNPIYHGNSGGPVFHLASGKVIAVVTEAKMVRTLNAVDKASFNNTLSAISGSMRYFGLRPDTVPKWEPYDWNVFLDQTTFLRNFHLQSRYLDSFLNGAHYEQAHLASPGDDDAPPDSKFYLRNDAIRNAGDSLHDITSNADKSERLDAQRMALMTLDGFADADLPAIKNSANFYGFEQTRAQQELAYRTALRGELDKIEDKLSDMGH